MNMKPNICKSSRNAPKYQTPYKKIKSHRNNNTFSGFSRKEKYPNFTSGRNDNLEKLKRSLSAGDLENLASQEKNGRQKKFNFRQTRGVKISKKKMKQNRKKRIKEKIAKIRKVYSYHQYKLKNLIKSQHKFYEKCIKGITNKIRKIEDSFRKNKEIMMQIKQMHQNYFHLDDVKSLGFLLNNKKYHSNNMINGSKLYFKINKIMVENQKLKERIKTLESKDFKLGRSDKVNLITNFLSLNVQDNRILNKIKYGK